MKMKDEVGHRYGMLTVIGRAPSINSSARWVCKCDCGNTVIAMGHHLRSGSKKSCGCLQHKNIVGQRFGRLVVLEELPGSRIRCKCDCGNETVVLRPNLRSGNTKSCGCLKKESGYSDLTGQRFGRLTVIRRVENPFDSHAAWLCKCDCGNETVVLSCNLKSGDTRSCGCLRKLPQIKDEMGNRYGKLTVIGPAPPKGKGAWWLCQCDCGNTTVASGGNLRNGNNRSCGCLRREKRKSIDG